jgi:hypothetical protein
MQPYFAFQENFILTQQSSRAGAWRRALLLFSTAGRPFPSFSHRIPRNLDDFAAEKGGQLYCNL